MVFILIHGGGGEKGRTVLGLANFLCRNYKEG